MRVRDKTRDRIMEGAVKIFSEKGFHMASMDEIANEVGVAKGTLYYNFANKAELFAALVVEGYEFIIEEISKQMTPTMSYSEELGKTIEANYMLFSEFSKLALILHSELTSGIEEKAKETIYAAKEKYIDFVTQIIKKGVAAGEFADADPELVAVGIIGALEEIFARKIVAGKTWTAEIVIKAIQDSVIYGIRKDRF